MDMIRLLLENGASVELVDQFVIENLLGIMNCEIADRLLELFDKDEGSYHVHDKVTNGTKVRFNKTMMCLIEVCHAYHQTIFGSNVEFDEFHKHLDLYEKVMVIANSKRKNIAEAFDKSYRSFHVLSRGYEKYVADFYNFYEILVYVILNDLEVTFNDTEYYRSNEFKNEKSIKIFKGTPYELAKSELVNRNFENIKLLIDYGININCGNSLILRTAYKAGEIGWINYFITKGAKLEGESNGFEEACKSNKTDVLEHWIRSGGVVPKNPEYPCINMACLLGNFDMIKLLVENGVDLSDAKRNGVRIACRLGFNKKLEYLLEHNAVLGRVCRYQLEYVCLVEDIESVKMILDHYDGLGVLEKRENMDRKDRKIKNDSFLSHEITGNSDRYKITKALLERGESIQNDDLIDGIKAAVAASNIEILKLLLAYKINHSNGSEIMEAAVQSENIEVIKLLLKNGLSVYGNTKILNVAFMTKNTENIRFLLENGAKISGDSLYLKHVDLDDIETLQLILNYCPDVCGTSFLLQAAIDKNNLEAVKLLLKNTVSLKNNEYNYVLWACRINNLEILKMLFAKGAKIRDGCESGVMQACESNNLEMLMLLFERSPNLVLNRDFGIKQAVRHKNLEMIKLLIKHGANLDSYVKSIMRIAIDTNDHKLIKFCQCRMLVVDKKLTSF
ncbi:putative ankyrin repeat protein L63 [Zancudomyces culisetae]|uniref:Putative ankyrin repeat protein L63 n=1 Tax=Zancudomyces culisetae TaxID=1213189 RepID=A0A1R1PVL7_ZANCU|nr:putative ankyrin repeat protein L63 [Zancudomyces culisetae]|eukprot:OMH85015.1 putative ankyrin repeat protein L63 [Zancudomyces culisetae]